MNPASIAVEGVKVAKGRESPANLILYILVGAVVEAYMRCKERNSMEPIYIPAGSELPVFIILIACAIVFPVVIALYMKNESKYKAAGWTGRYLFTMVIDMFLAPSLGLILLSLLAQEWFPDMDPVTYMVLLPIIMAIVAYYSLMVMNQGIKGTVEQIKGTVAETREAVVEIKATASEAKAVASEVKESAEELKEL